MDVTISPALRPRDRVEALHGRLTDLLDALDDAELHAPAAYVSMALDTILRDFPELSATR
jgi:hypothetical protein